MWSAWILYSHRTSDVPSSRSSRLYTLQASHLRVVRGVTRVGAPHSAQQVRSCRRADFAVLRLGLLLSSPFDHAWIGLKVVDAIQDHVLGRLHIPHH